MIFHTIDLKLICGPLIVGSDTIQCLCDLSEVLNGLWFLLVNSLETLGYYDARMDLVEISRLSSGRLRSSIISSSESTGKLYVMQSLTTHFNQTSTRSSLLSNSIESCIVSYQKICSTVF